MLTISLSRRFFVARKAQDMRRGMDALAAVVRSELDRDPSTGDCFIFISRNRKRLKALYYEDGGYWLGMKRLDRGSFARISDDDADPVAISSAQLHALLEGIEFQVTRHRRRERRVAGNNCVIKYQHERAGCPTGSD